MQIIYLQSLTTILKISIHYLNCSEESFDLALKLGHDVRHPVYHSGPKLLVNTMSVEKLIYIVDLVKFEVLGISVALLKKTTYFLVKIHLCHSDLFESRIFHLLGLALKISILEYLRCDLESAIHGGQNWLCSTVY